ncbi:hypothetical protein [Scytonema sp. NUACC26]|uniref:hypothetical protein n=1 Tax=Scytonema sp. NUACC26 TaxID=3140176 RepID=UPI0034DBCD39
MKIEITIKLASDRSHDFYYEGIEQFIGIVIRIWRNSPYVISYRIFNDNNQIVKHWINGGYDTFVKNEDDIQEIARIHHTITGCFQTPQEIINLLK